MWENGRGIVGGPHIQQHEAKGQCKGISADQILALVRISCLSSTPTIGCYLGQTSHICTYPMPPSPF